MTTRGDRRTFRYEDLVMLEVFRQFLHARWTPTLALALLSAAAVRGDDWPQWRGPIRDGAWSETGIVQSFPPGC